MTATETALVGFTGLFGVVMAAEGGTKLAGRESRVERFREFGYPQWFRVVTGSLELVGALWLLVGIVTDGPFVLAGGAVLATVLVGAVTTHVRVGDPLSELLPATALLVTALVVLAFHTGLLF